MRFALAIIGLTLAGTPNAAALDVRPASEAEIEQALVGCWEREPTREPLELAAGGITNDYSVCFHPGNVVETTIFMGSYINGVPDFEGIGDSGRFEVSSGKLKLSGIQESGWTSARALVSCDVLMTADHAEMRLENCVGAGADPNADNQDPELIPNISFAKVAE